MAFIRRGNITFPHKPSAQVTLHRVDGMAFLMRLNVVNCWEEHSLPNGALVTIVHWDVANCTSVAESFDDLKKMFGAFEVAR